MNISIIIPNYNGAKYLKICIESLHKQIFKDYELIIIDNASSDESVNIIESYDNIKLIKLDKNYGFDRAVNEGIKIAKGEYVILLNNDTEADEEWLSNLVKCIEKDENIFSCSSKMIRYYERDKIDDAGDGYNILGWAYKRGDGSAADKYKKDEEIFSSCAGAAIYRKKIFDEIGYFDEEYFAYIEDIDISYRAKIFGYKNIYCSDAIIYHMASATSGSKYNAFKARLISRNNIYTIYKNMPTLQILVNLPLILSGIAIKFIFYYKKGLGKEYSQGIIEAILKLSYVKKNKYSSKHLLNYVKIEIEMIINLFKFLLMKIFKLDV